MSFFDYLDKLRNQPEITRRRILVGTSFGLTALICVVWVSVRFYGPGPLSNITQTNNEVGPIEQAGEAIGTFLDNMRVDIAAAKEAINSAATSTASTTSPAIDSEIASSSVPELSD